MSEDACDLLCLDAPKAEAVRASLPHADELEQAALQMKALADPTRLQIAHALREGGELCVCDLSWVVGRRESLVSHHVRLLRAAGLATSRRDGKMVMYLLAPLGQRLLATTEEVAR